MIRLLLSIRRLGGAGAVSNAREELVASHARVVAARAVCHRVETIDHARTVLSSPAGSGAWDRAVLAEPGETRRAA